MKGSKRRRRKKGPALPLTEQCVRAVIMVVVIVLNERAKGRENEKETKKLK